MVSVFYRIGLYVSSFFPLYVLLIINNYEYFSSFKKLKKIFLFQQLLPSLFGITLLILIFISIISIVVIKTVSLNERRQFKGICKTEDKLLNYVVTYLVPILSIKVDEGKSLMVNACLFSLLGYIYVKNSLVYLNPLFLFFKYNVFITDKHEVVISNYDIYELKNLESERIRTRILSYKIYLVRKTKPDV
jgi:hypothetical protein